MFYFFFFFSRRIPGRSRQRNRTQNHNFETNWVDEKKKRSFSIWFCIKFMWRLANAENRNHIYWFNWPVWVRRLIDCVFSFWHCGSSSGAATIFNIPVDMRWDWCVIWIFPHINRWLFPICGIAKAPKRPKSKRWPECKQTKTAKKKMITSIAHNFSFFAIVYCGWLLHSPRDYNIKCDFPNDNRRWKKKAPMTMD